jgi:PAS domain S-box-containing protein
MIMVDHTGTIVIVNQEIERLFGYTRHELLGQSIELLVPEPMRGPHPALRAGYLTHPTARRMGAGRDLFGLRKDGTRVPVEIGLNPVETENGTFVLASVVDITERQRAAAERESLLRRLVDLQEQERRDLAHELHDQVGQLLTALKLMLETDALGGVEEMKLLVKEIQECVRGISTNLHPPTLDDFGLLHTLQWHFPRYTQQTGIRVTFEQSGLDARFARRLEAAAFRIVQEALTNVARHTRVTEVRVAVLAQESRLRMLVEDAGPGFDVDAAARGGLGSGIMGMRERARALNGSLNVETGPGSGVRIVVELPLEQPAP